MCVLFYKENTVYVDGNYKLGGIIVLSRRPVSTNAESTVNKLYDY